MRLALHIGGFEFEDRRVGYAEIEALRKSGKLAYGQVPMLEIDGKAYTQSSALLAWAGARGGLYPESLRLRIDGANACLADITGLLGPKWYKHLGGRDPATSQFYPDLALSEEQVGCAVFFSSLLCHRHVVLLRRWWPCILMNICFHDWPGRCFGAATKRQHSSEAFCSARTRTRGVGRALPLWQCFDHR